MRIAIDNIAAISYLIVTVSADLSKERVMRKTYACAWCFEINEIFVDVSAGLDQKYVETCQVCCRNNSIHVRIDYYTRAVTLENEAEG
jgi:hypothetical protein